LRDLSGAIQCRRHTCEQCKFNKNQILKQKLSTKTDLCEKGHLAVDGENMS
jgi:hypothetical protein